MSAKPLDPLLDLLCAHEAGHALVGHLFGGRLVRCEVFGSRGEGRTKSIGLSLRRRLRVAVAGYKGVELLLGAARAVPDDADGDVAQAVEIAFAIARLGEARRLAARGLAEPTEKMFRHYSARAERLILAAEADVAEILASDKPALLALAARLCSDGTLSHETLAAIVSGVRA